MPGSYQFPGEKGIVRNVGKLIMKFNDVSLRPLTSTMSGIAMTVLTLTAAARADVAYVAYQTPLDIPKDDPGGLYLNVVTGRTGDNPEEVPGWDVESFQLSQGYAYAKLVFTTPNRLR